MITTSCGSATGWSAGQTPFDAYAMCDLWSGLSSRVPSQHSGKMTCRRSDLSPQLGTSTDASLASRPQPQKTTSLLCGVNDVELPPTIMKPTGKGFTAAYVVRR